MNKRKSSVEELDVSSKKMKNGRLIFNSVVTLETIAAVKIAIALWYHQNIRNIRSSLGYDWRSSIPENNILESDDEDIAGEKFRFTYHVNELIENCCQALDLPETLKEEVEKHLSPIEKQIDSWKSYQQRRIFFDHDEQDVYKYLSAIIWRPDGEIDYRNTAKRMLLSPNINQVEKYRIICVYCLEEEMKNLSPIIFNNEFRERVLFERHPLIYYWNCSRKLEFNEITVENFESVRSRVISSENALDNECAIQYFLSRLSPPEKLEKAKMLIRQYKSKFQCISLQLLEESELHQIFEEMAANIIINFVENFYHSEYALNVWINVQDFISENQCIDVWKRLIELTIDGTNYKIVPKVVTIWKNTAENLKLLVLTYKNNSMIKKILYGSNQCLMHNLEYLLEMLCDASVELRKFVIFSDEIFYWCFDDEITYSDRSFLHRCICICLPDKLEALEFKKRVLEAKTSENLCFNYCKNGKVNDLDEFLDEFLPDRDAMDSYKEKVFISHAGVAYFVGKLNAIDLNSFKTNVQKILTRNDSADRFMKKLIMSNAALEKFHEWILKCELDRVKDCVENLLTDVNDRNAVKLMLLHVYREENILKLFTESDAHSCEEFLSYCLYDEENVSQFKDSLPLEYVFETMLNRSIFLNYDRADLKNHLGPVRNEIDLSSLDRFLLWFFDSLDKVKKYKIDQMYKFHRMRTISSDNYWDDEILKRIRVFEWFLGSDEKEIQKFKSSYKLCRFSSDLLSD